MPDSTKSGEAVDVRCPHCGVVVLKKERINPDADRMGAPEFCPRCGERTEPERPRTHREP